MMERGKNSRMRGKRVKKILLADFAFSLSKRFQPRPLEARRLPPRTLLPILIDRSKEKKVKPPANYKKKEGEEDKSKAKKRGWGANKAPPPSLHTLFLPQCSPLSLLFQVFFSLPFSSSLSLSLSLFIECVLLLPPSTVEKTSWLFSFSLVAGSRCCRCCCFRFQIPGFFSSFSFSKKKKIFQKGKIHRKRGEMIGQKT